MNEELEVGMEGIVKGRWMIVEEVNDDDTGWAVDQDGGSHLVTIGSFDHIY
jgi:hypothetical protein